MPQGDWAASCLGVISDGFRDELSAKDWCLGKMDRHLDGLLSQNGRNLAPLAARIQLITKQQITKG